MINSADEIIELHNSSGLIEDAYKRVHLDNKIFFINTYTLRFRKGTTSKEETRKWNLILSNEIKKNRDLQKEVREYLSVFEMFSKLHIKSGKIEKSECPDFVLTRNGKKTGIEITKIYVGNEWVAEKVAEEIRAFKLRRAELDGYLEYKKFQNRITTFNIRGGIVIMPLTDNISSDEYIVEVKNKIFEKIRRQLDEYKNYDSNVIYVEVVSPVCFNNEKEFQILNNEIKFYVEHLEGLLIEGEYKIILKTGDLWHEFDIKNGNYYKL